MIEIKNLVFAYDRKRVFDGLNMKIERSACLTGPSGCGKTTLLRLIAGLEKIQSGSITGVPERIDFMFQEDRLLPWLTAKENVAAVLPNENREKAERLLAAVGLEDKITSLPSGMSGGQMRRVSLARALAYGGELLLLDEPFKGFDPELAARMAALIRAQNIPFIAALHSPEEIGLMEAELIKLP